MEDISESDIAIETNLTDEERAIIARGAARYREHPEEFIALDSVIEKVKKPRKRINYYNLTYTLQKLRLHCCTRHHCPRVAPRIFKIRFL